MRALDLFSILLHWAGGLIGVIGCLIGFSVLPGLFDVGHSDNLLFVVFDIPFSKSILEAFSFPWQMLILAGGVFLYAWICFLFLFSTHILITTTAKALNHRDGTAAAWTAVFVIGVLLAIIFVVLLYGVTLNQLTVAVGLLILAITGFLFAVNYAESDEGEPHVVSYY